MHLFIVELCRQNNLEKGGGSFHGTQKRNQQEHSQSMQRLHDGED
jgi:hypothetical protein